MGRGPALMAEARLGARATATDESAAPTRRRDRAPVTPLRSRAYELIKDRIIDLTYAPGRALNEAQISDHLKIGRTPVHMAVMRLAQEGLIEIVPRKGVRVAPLTLESVRAILEARLLSEPAAARLAAERATNDQLEQLRTLFQKSLSPSRPVDRVQLATLDKDFHEIIALAAHNDVLRKMLASLHDQARRLFHVAWNFDSGLDMDTMAEHQDIVDAIMSRDPAGAERAMRVHLHSAGKALESILSRTLVLDKLGS